MQVMPGYKQTDVGLLPTSWNCRTLGDICSKIQDGTHFSPRLGGTDFLYLTSKNVRAGFLDIRDAESIDAAQHQAIYKRCDVRQGDILLTKDGANTGNAALNNLASPFSLLSSVAFLRFDQKEHDALYFLYQILSPRVQQQIAEAMSGNAITRLTLNKIRKLRIPFAPLCEQRAISCALRDTDMLIQNLTDLIAKRRDCLKGAMQRLLTGTVRLPAFAGSWRKERIGDIVTTDPENLPSSTDATYGFNYIALEDVERGRLRGFSQQHFGSAPSRARRKLRRTDILASTVRPQLGSHLLFTETGEWVCSTGFCVIRCDRGGVSPHYIYWHLFGNCLNRQIDASLTGSSYPSINSSDIRSLEIPLPELAEQAAIAQVLSDIDAEIEALEQRLAKTRAIKQAMMQELLTGRTPLVSHDAAHA